MKKSIVLPIVAALMSVVVAVSVAAVVKNSQFGVWNNCYQGVWGLEPEGQYKGDGFDIVKTKKNLHDLVGDVYDETYNSAYFMTNSLIVIELSVNGYTANWLKDVYRKGNTLVVELNSYTGVISHGMPRNRRFLIEVKKWETIGANEIELKITEVDYEEYGKV